VGDGFCQLLLHATRRKIRHLLCEQSVVAEYVRS
jgi:hypothetical protein